MLLGPGVLVLRVSAASSIVARINDAVLVIQGVHHPSECQLPVVVQALDVLSLLFGQAHGWQQQRRQECYDRNDHQQFDQRERQAPCAIRGRRMEPMKLIPPYSEGVMVHRLHGESGNETGPPSLESLPTARWRIEHERRLLGQPLRARGLEQLARELIAVTGIH